MWGKFGTLESSQRQAMQTGVPTMTYFAVFPTDCLNPGYANLLCHPFLRWSITSGDIIVGPFMGRKMLCSKPGTNHHIPEVLLSHWDQLQLTRDKRLSNMWICAKTKSKYTEWFYKASRARLVCITFSSSSSMAYPTHPLTSPNLPSAFPSFNYCCQYP